MQKENVDLESRQSFKIVRQFFNGDIQKTTEWFVTKNPMLGNEKPIQMIMLGREGKLIRCIHDLIHGNLP